jgi:hypothetical protein
VVEGARLESVYTPQGYRGFESLPLCKENDAPDMGAFLFEGVVKRSFSLSAETKNAIRHEMPKNHFLCEFLVQDGR